MRVSSVIPKAAAVIAIASFSWLGLWQIERAGEKELRKENFATRSNDAPILINQRLNITPAEIDPDWWRYRRVELSGDGFAERQYLLDNRTRHGVAGYHVYLPILVTGVNRVVLVNRGWLETGVSRERLPDISLDAASLVVSGIVDRPRQTLLLGDDGYAGTSWPKVVQRIDPAKTAHDLKRPVLPFVILMDATQPHGFAREWSPYLGIGPERHRGYAFQWLSLAAAVAVVWIVVHVRRVRQRR